MHIINMQKADASYNLKCMSILTVSVPCKGPLRGKASEQGPPHLSGQVLELSSPDGNFQELASRFYLHVNR